MFNVVLTGSRELLLRFDAMPPNVRKALAKKVFALTLMLEARVKTKLTNQVLRVRTGNLRASIFQRTWEAGTALWGAVFSNGSVKYAGIHEFGGVIQHPGGTAYIAKNPNHILGTSGGVTFISNAAAANMKAVLRTKPHPIPVPARSFLRSSLRDMDTDIVRGLKQAAVEAIARGA